MKKIVSVLLAMTIALSTAACGASQPGVTSQTTPATTENKPNTAVSVTDSPIYGQLGPMIPPLEKFVEYNLIMNNSIDYLNLDSEDYWNIVALGISSYEYASDIATVDNGGMYHVPWAQAVDFSKTFMYDYWYKFGAPTIKTSYSTTADPGSGVLDFVPLDVNNYDAQLTAITETKSDSGDDYVLSFDLSGRDGDNTVHHYLVYIDDWADFIWENYREKDTETHILPFVVTHFEYLGYDEAAETK